MGFNQHLVRSIMAIIAQGGVKLANGDMLMPDPILVGRNKDKIAALAQSQGISALVGRSRRLPCGHRRHAVFRRRLDPDAQQASDARH